MFQPTRRAMCGVPLNIDDSQPSNSDDVPTETNHGERIIQRGDDMWTVREMNTEHVPGARGRRCLICESTAIVRRLWNYPEDWANLSDEALLRLCAGEGA